MSNLTHVFSGFYVRKDLIGKNPVFLHVGSYTGEIEKILTDMFPDCQIYSIEAHPANFEELCHNTKDMVNLTRINAAMTDSSEREIFISGIKGAATTYKVSGGIKVKGITLSEFTRDFSIDSIDCIFYNAEGSEMDFMPHLMESGSYKRVKQVCVNFHVHVKDFGITYDSVMKMIKDAKIDQFYSINDDRVSRIASTATGVPISERYPCFLFFRDER